MKKINILKLSLMTLVLALAVLGPAHTSAATTDITGGTNGPLCTSGGYFTPSSITVTSGDTITFSVPSNDPYAGGVQVNGFPQGSFVVPRGGSVTTQALTANASYQGTWPNSPSCIKGSGTVTVKAASTSPPPSGGTSSSGSSSPTSKSSTPKSAAASTESTTSTTSTSSTNKTATPETVVADTITVGGQKVTSEQNLTISQSQPLTLSGTTVPNGKITLTIHSNPTTATVQADPSGKWSYTVTGLQPGDHTIYATVTDPATKKTSASSKLLAFTISAAPVASVTPATPTVAVKKSSSMMLPITIAAVVLLIIVAVIIVVLKKRASNKPGSSVASPMVAPASPQNLPQAPGAGPNPQTPPAPNNNSNEIHKDNL